LAALPLYNVGYAERFGEAAGEISYSVQLQSGNTVIEDGGLLTPGTPAAGVLSPGKPVIYTLDVGEGETVTFHRDYAQGSPEYYFLNANGYDAGIFESFVNTASSVNWVIRLDGPPPYSYYMGGEGSYTLLLEAGDTLERHELGTLAPGEVLWGTVPLPDDRLDYITLDVNPEATVTLNWNVPQSEYAISDGAGYPVYPSNDDWTDGYAIVDLSQGTPPFTVSMDNAYNPGQPFTLTLAEGETPLSPDAAVPANTSGDASAGTDTETQSGSDAQADGGCTVSASSNINQRSGPGTDFAVSGTLAGGSSASVDGQTTGADGFTWYRLTTGAWVRGDLVTATAGCSGVPQVTP
jgi:hypothetical protein